MRVNLTYFKTSGKYYSHGTLEVPNTLPRDLGGLKAGTITPLFEIWELVRHLQVTRRLPGLAEGCSSFHVWVDVPEHPHRHPHLVLNDAYPDRWENSFEYREVLDAEKPSDSATLAEIRDLLG